MFVARQQDEHGVTSLTGKQVAWLGRQLDQENLLPSVRSSSTTVRDFDGAYYKLVIYPNGAGFLRRA